MSATPNARASGRSADGGSAEAGIPQSAATPENEALPSPFTPIANYAFLSNCHTGALVAPDGTVDWLCVPRFDSPSVFGALLDRGAGGFRFGPFGINVPSDRIYEPGTNTLVTSWRTPTGWVVVRDALTMGPRRGEDTVTPHTRPPSDEDANHALVRTAHCIDGSAEIDLVCEPGFDYGRFAGEWTLSPDRHRADAKGGEQALRLQTDMHLGIEAGRARARHVLRAGETVYCALAWSDEALVPTNGDEAADQLAATTRFWRDWLARAAIPDHELGPMIQRSALTIAALTTGNWSLLREAMRDRIHQPYRAPMIPGFEEILALTTPGLLGVALSGAGPTVFAFAEIAAAECVGRAIAGVFEQHGVKAAPHFVNIDNAGRYIDPS